MLANPCASEKFGSFRSALQDSVHGSADASTHSSPHVVDYQREVGSMMQFPKCARPSITAMVAASSLLIAAVPDAYSHPFTFNTDKMAGFRVVTSEEGAMEAKDMVVIEYSGAITSPMAGNLRHIWNEIAMDSRFQNVVLRLNSPGGTETEGEEVIGVLREIRERVTLLTLVAEHDLCASMCIPIFIQGESRHASPASAWMFHGATRSFSNVPSLSLTLHYVDYFKERGVGMKFVNALIEENYITTPGEYWISGDELATESDIVTRLDPNWKPAPPDPGPMGGIRSGI